tara:strand:+ start:431 stop:601 length:171 start_codon:yes stop_codon:yes gene_type:complete
VSGSLYASLPQNEAGQKRSGTSGKGGKCSGSETVIVHPFFPQHFLKKKLFLDGINI